MLNELAKQCYEIAVSKGWYDKEVTFSDYISNMHCELSEAFQMHRDGHKANQIFTRTDNAPCGIPIELADLIIRVLGCCHAYDINIDAAVNAKMEYNKTRPYRHGGKIC